MPTEVTPSYSYSVPIPTAHRIPMAMPMPMPMHQGWLSQSHPNPSPSVWRSSPPDPAQAPAGSSWDTISRRHIPGSVLANGTRCDWTPYAGETYVPAANNVLGAEARQVRSCAGAGTFFTPNAAAASASGAVMGNGGGGSRVMSSIGGGGSSILSRGSCGSMVPPIGGYRQDDGWAGSTGRVHLGHAPDMSTTAGAIGLGSGIAMGLGSTAGSSMIFSHAPAGYGNHARMTPTVAAGLAAETELLTPISITSSPSHRSLPAPVSILKGQGQGKHHKKGSERRFEADCDDCRGRRGCGECRRRDSTLRGGRSCRECQYC
ncbi:hypothetical protein I317_03992 [Kwoniella heveanensis CBS 569]|nr:hypothetical protein I317_03992 [Kwoniella heveanensis CBS 569]